MTDTTRHEDTTQENEEPILRARYRLMTSKSKTAIAERTYTPATAQELNERLSLILGRDNVLDLNPGGLPGDGVELTLTIGGYDKDTVSANKEIEQEACDMAMAGKSTEEIEQALGREFIVLREAITRKVTSVHLWS